MPRFDIVRKTKVPDSFRVQWLLGKYDMNPEHVNESFVGDIPIEDTDWQIGLIHGASGSGKSTIAKELFPDAYVTDFEYSNEPIIDAIAGDDVSETQIAKVLNSVGFSSPPSWLKPYAVLSQGEKMRVDIARAILSPAELIVFDEFTSTVDRTVAKYGSIALAKAIRKSDKKFIAVTCHSDVLKYLTPDWSFSTDDFSFQKKNSESPESSSTFTAQRLPLGSCLVSITI